MNCSEIQSRLSAYHDGELSPAEAADVAAHLAGCAACEAELASFEQLSSLSRRLTDPPVPERMWPELQAKLDGPTTSSSLAELPALFPGRLTSRPLALAAAVLIAVGFGIFGYLNWPSRHGHEDRHLAMNFAHYLEEFNESPDAAQQTLLVNYDGRPISLTDATNVLGYEPLAARHLPPEYAVDQAFLLKMPCCTCAQVMCSNEAGQSIAIFEHDIDQPVWFGDRPAIECLCHEIPTSVVQVANRLAATWKEGKRYITIIGARDLNEVTNFVAHFSGARSAQSQPLDQSMKAHNRAGAILLVGW